ncbi:hypothetical protein [Undibacterium umbellatum]|uniref:Lipoprotein n=1 Tax=Undibacterium umbellatum TaxID=2762300 RepID=A0ABR6Z3L2_9BURK|nr:hypothetical protein [Undibacterium umbellatum]MBC3906327.1 hypothetical protein [Undibacterium umbellatum]
MTLFRKFSLSILICCAFASCGGGSQGSAPSEQVIVKELNASNFDRLFATYLLEQYRTVKEMQLLLDFRLLADWSTSAIIACPNGGTIKNFASIRFEFDKCATSKGIIFSGMLDSDTIGILFQQSLTFQKLKYRMADDTQDQELNGRYLSGYRNPNTFSYSYLVNGIANTYSRSSIQAPDPVKIVTTEFNLELTDVNRQGLDVPHIVNAKDGSNITIASLGDGSVRLDLRNSAGAAIVSTKQYTANEVASILVSERKSK